MSGGEAVEDCSAFVSEGLPRRVGEIVELCPAATVEMVYKRDQEPHGVASVDLKGYPSSSSAAAAVEEGLLKMSGGEAIEDSSAVVSEGLTRPVGEIAELCPGAPAEMVYKRDQEPHGVALVDSNQVPPPDYPSTSPSAAAALHQPLINYSGRRRQRGPSHWCDEEYALFLLGVELYGHGNWTEISDNAVRTRTHVQLKSHSQKYYIQQEKNKRETKGKEIQGIHDRTLYDYPLDNLCILITSRPVLKDRLKSLARSFAFNPDVMYFLRFWIDSSLPPLLPPPLIRQPQPPTEILLSEEPEKKGTVDKGESSSGRDQQEN